MRWWLPALALAACTGEEPEQEIPPPIVGPELSHTPPAGPFITGESATLVVQAEDEDGVDSVSVYYRNVDSLVWENEVMVEGESGWTLDVPLSTPQVLYYLRGVDGSDYHAASTLPASAEDDPFVLAVSVEPVAIPFQEDFEDAISQFSLFDLGWTTISQEFEGAGWRADDTTSASGSWSARHPRGPDGTLVDDWLISPPLDLTTLPDPQIGWLQRGSEDAETGPSRSLWISTTTAEPAAFEKLVDVEPELGWNAVTPIDLSGYADQDTAWLAWRYEGDGGDWVIDDIAVGVLDPSLVLTDVVQTLVEPGDTTSLTVTLDNRGSDTVGDVSVWVQGDDVVSGAPVNVGPILSATDVQVKPELTVDGLVPEDAVIDLEVVAEDTVNQWVFPVQLTIGEPAVARVQLQHDSLGLVQAFVGKGDPDAPLVEEPVVQDIVEAGTHVYAVDLSPWRDELPPAPGADRWWLRVEATAPGTVTAFTIEDEGALYIGDDLGGYDFPDIELFNLPAAPMPVEEESTTDPSPVAPEDLVQWELLLRNDGGDTVGRTLATVSTSDPDITVFTSTASVLSEDGWLADETSVVDVSFGVGAGQNDDQPIVFDVVIEDDVESILLEVPVAVPWPVLATTEVAVDDWSDGNGDQVLDAGEVANLEVRLTNTGSIDTGAAVVCTASQATGATIDVDSDYFGFIAVGGAKSGEIGITADANLSVGDIVRVDLDCVDDDGRSYPASASVPVGEVPYQVLAQGADAIGDANGYAFDQVQVRWRVVGDRLDLELISAAPYDPSTVFAEVWLSSPGAAWDLYQVVAQSGAGSLVATDFTLGPTSLPDPSVTAVDDTTLRISTDLSAYGLVVDTLNVGVGTGFCPGPYYCDQLPDGFGDPYVNGIDESVLASISW